MSTNVISGGPAHFLSYINDPVWPLVYQRPEEWLLTMDNMHRLPEKKIENQPEGFENWRVATGQNENFPPCILEYILFLVSTFSTCFTEPIWTGGT